MERGLVYQFLQIVDSRESVDWGKGNSLLMCTSGGKPAKCSAKSLKTSQILRICSEPMVTVNINLILGDKLNLKKILKWGNVFFKGKDKHFKTK